MQSWLPFRNNLLKIRQFIIQKSKNLFFVFSYFFLHIIICKCRRQFDSLAKSCLFKLRKKLKMVFFLPCFFPNGSILNMYQDISKFLPRNFRRNPLDFHKLSNPNFLRSFLENKKQVFNFFARKNIFFIAVLHRITGFLECTIDKTTEKFLLQIGIFSN